MRKDGGCSEWDGEYCWVVSVEVPQVREEGCRWGERELQVRFGGNRRFLCQCACATCGLRGRCR